MPAAAFERPPDWETFYANHRRPGYVRGLDITRRLGGGASGLVFHAVRQSVGREYAIKFLQLDGGAAPQAVERELAQLEHFAQLDHPNLVAIEDRGVVDGIPYVVMAYAGQETLRAWIGRPDVRSEALALFAQACRGVAALHERGLVHFDLKPENVFVRDGVARVGDYGLGKLVAGGRGSLSVARGTPIYMAPEVVQQRGDARSDVYSLGVMLFEILTGSPPFVGATVLDVLRLHEQQEPIFPPAIAARERALLQRCLAKDPAARPADVRELIEALTEPTAPPRAAAAASAAAGPSPRVPPVLPHASTPRAEPPPLPGERAAAPRSRARRGARGALLLALAFVGLFAVPFVWQRDQEIERLRRLLHRRVAAPTDTRTAGRGESALQDEIRQLAERLDRPTRGDGNRMQPLDPAKVRIPVDVALYRDRIAELDDPALVRAGGSWDRLGHPFFVTCVQWLQEQDYRDLDACRHAAAIQLVLQQMTGAQGLALAPPLDDVDASTRRRFMLAATVWRELAECHCADPGAWKALLQGTGKLPPDPRKN